jgi:hypothetical protein
MEGARRCELGKAYGEFDLSYLAKVREGATGMVRILLGGCTTSSRFAIVNS